MVDSIVSYETIDGQYQVFLGGLNVGPAFRRHPSRLLMGVRSGVVGESRVCSAGGAFIRPSTQQRARLTFLSFYFIRLEIARPLAAGPKCTSGLNKFGVLWPYVYTGFNAL